MVKSLVVVAALAIVGSGCAETKPTLMYQYEVQGKGDDVSVTYLAEDNELVAERVDLPWTSDEFEGTGESLVRLEVEGPQGSRVRCILRQRTLAGEYGGNGSGESSQYAGPDEDQTVCALTQERISSGV